MLSSNGKHYESSIPESISAIELLMAPSVSNIVIDGNDTSLSSSLDGTYVLYVYATDWCGNKGEASIELYFDTTAPVLATEFDANTNAEDGLASDYYNKDFSVKFTITDNNALDTSKFSYKVNGVDVSTLENVSASVSGDGTCTSTVKISVSSDSLTNEYDGTYTFTIYAEDKAGNMLTVEDSTSNEGSNKMVGTGTEGEFENNVSKILDTISPEVTAITSTGSPQGSDDANETPYTVDGTEVFYYSAESVAFTFTVTDTNVAQTWSGVAVTTTPIGGSSPEFEPDYEAGDGSGVVTVTLSGDGKYTGIAITGTDLAGNKLTLAGSYTPQTVDTAATATSDDTVTLTYGMILDTVAPKATIAYSSDATAYVYGSTDDNAGAKGAAYYNDEIAIEVVVEDENLLDTNKLTLGSYKDNSELGDTAVGALSSMTGDATTCVSADGSITVAADGGNDGKYNYLIYGTDRVGNALTVAEEIETPLENKGAEKTATEEENCKGSYTSQFGIVLDTVQPTFVLTVDRSSATNKSLQAGRYYFNSDYTATVTVTETNFDSERIAVSYASGTATGTGAVTFSTEDYEASYEWSGSSSPYTWTETVSDEGVYRYRMSGTDKAGNALTYSDTTELQDTTNLLSYYIEVDKTDPTGTLTVNDYYEIDIADGSLSKSEPYRDETSATVNITTADLSPVLIGYTIDSTVDGTSAKSAGYGYQQTASTAVSGEQVFAVTGITVTDRAGNQISLDTTNSIYLDVTPPTMDTLAPTISVEAEANDSHHTAEGTPLFSKDVPLHIVVTDPYGGTRSSGLSTVTYQLYINGSEVTGDAKTLNPTSTTSWSNNYSDPTLTFTIDETITVDADSHNYNDIEVIVNAVDNAGNTNTRTYSFGIDTTAPTIEITYDNNDAENEKYFKATRTATIVVTERNFDSDLISISTESRVFSGWDYEAGSSANGDDDTWTATIAYNVDGDYTLTVEGEDLLGHEADVTYEGVATREFTIDMTAPTIELTFDNNNVANGKYYNASRTATLTVTDVNFAGTSDIAVLASGGGAAPSFNFAGGYSSSATFSVDGVYSFSGTVTDLAGNVSLPVSCDEFVIDQTAPELEIFDIEDRSANNGEVRPGVRYSDTNYDASATSIVLTGYYNGVVEMNGTTTYTENGLEIKLDDFEYVQDMDDMYTMEAVVYDLAGNSSEDSVLFSVNRFGSVYIYDDDTAALVGEDGSYYTNEEQDIVVTETNVDTLEFKEITLNLDDSLTTLVEGEDYTVDESGTDVSWKQYTYTIDEENFVDEGTYIVTIYSEDRATNTSDNNTKGKKIEFVVDKTNPSILISGVEEDGQYREASREVTLDVEDNIQMAEVVVEVDGVETTYSASEVLDADGKIVMTVGSANHWQSIRVTALDVAGNVRTASVERFLITPNIFVQFYMNKVLFWSTVGVALLLALLAGRRYFLIAAKRRKKKEEEQ
ncbi:MAG: Ig-like domain repeat protein [Lachnospiraceae bacterium]|nr:Ig-like domain repeat protein [Lachnospiraceae bacterium]